MKCTVWKLGMTTHHGPFNFPVPSLAAAPQYSSCCRVSWNQNVQCKPVLSEILYVCAVCCCLHS